MNARNPMSILARGALFALAGAAPLCAQGQQNDPVAATRSTLEQWVETRSTISKESRDWALAKESLQARMDVVRRETESDTGLMERVGCRFETVLRTHREFEPVVQTKAF